MLRLAFALVLSMLLLPLTSQAGCSPTMSGESSKRSITISDCDHPTMMILISDFSETSDGGVPRDPVPFAAQCKKSAAGFSCRRHGKTPLAGSRYHYTHDTNPSCQGRRSGTRLTCVAGCAAGIPRYFYIAPWEC
jgi:hypothetical protein